MDTMYTDFSKLLTDTTAEIVMEVPMADGTYYPFRPIGMIADTVDSDHVVLLLPLASEHTEAGRGLVRAMWFCKETYLWINNIRYTVVPCRCHIVGETFSRLYDRAKGADPNAEVSAVWELHVMKQTCTNDTLNNKKAPIPRPLHVAGEPEHHLDHPSYHQ